VKQEGTGFTIAGPIVLFFILQIASNLPGIELPVQLGFLGAVVALGVSALKDFRLYWQRLFMAVFLVAVSIGSGGPMKEPPLFDLFKIGVPICWAIAAIGDHRALVRSFARLQGGPRDIAWR
jgi:hypothetical protein